MLFEMKMTPLSTILAIVILHVCYVQGELQCTTPTGRNGQCIAVTECPALIALIQKTNRTAKELKLLRESHCGFNEQNMPKTCCETVVDQTDRRCFTPDANIGTCVSLESCPQLKNLLQPPVTAERLAFVQNSRCEGPEQYSVCCGPEINNVTRPSRMCVPSVAPPDPRTECCGLDSSSGNRIFGGNETAIDQYPWLTMLEYRGTKDNKIKLFCGGSLISSKYVLTAAHCVVGGILAEGTPVNVRLGEYDTANNVDCVEVEGGGQDCNDPLIIVPIEKIIPHRDYNPDSPLRRHDIALLRLKDEAPYTDFIRPICLPINDIMQTTSPKMLLVAGWGAISDTKRFSNIKLHVELPYIPLKECQLSYEAPSRKVTLWNGQICAGGVAGKDSCKGDSGGPLMYDTGRIHQVVGVVSFGTTPCGLENVPGVYTKVYEYLPWIRSQMKP
ncbi:phenoloxidase-activating enzyme-like isoform X3 [Nymphalis io]|uniref:phenoloxidase-activating enzyme-like isoform X3 n=1 Tax=Inachis io TaxID=171585 RepID=UPI00216846B4|nr:phenoloxidase-activating enzyme-like isoform X3 [Nymphalis io]